MKFYRVANNDTKQGLWYDWDGKFTGKIHNEFSFCKNSTLPMPYDEEIRGWLSATDTLESLLQWFTKEDIQELEKHGYFITIYEASDYKDYQNHQIIKQDTSIVIDTILISTLL